MKISITADRLMERRHGCLAALFAIYEIFSSHPALKLFLASGVYHRGAQN